MAVFTWGRADRKGKAVGGTRTCHCCQPTGTHDPDRKASQSGGKKSAHEVHPLWGWFTMRHKHIWGISYAFVFALVYELLMHSPPDQDQRTNSGNLYHKERNGCSHNATRPTTTTICNDSKQQHDRILCHTCRLYTKTRRSVRMRESLQMQCKPDFSVPIRWKRLTETLLEEWGR